MTVNRRRLPCASLRLIVPHRASLLLTIAGGIRVYDRRHRGYPLVVATLAFFLVFFLFRFCSPGA